MKVILLCFGVAIGIMVLDLFVPLGVAAGVPYVLVILLSLWSPGRRLPIYMAMLTSCFVIVGFYFSPQGGAQWQVISNRALAVFAIWVTAILSLQRRRFLDEKLDALSELKILRGLLSICASCKKIREDSGQWTPIESYVHEHSEASFSHGICPECEQRLYPDI